MLHILTLIVLLFVAFFVGAAVMYFVNRNNTKRFAEADQKLEELIKLAKEGDLKKIQEYMMKEW